MWSTQEERRRTSIGGLAPLGPHCISAINATREDDVVGPFPSFVCRVARFGSTTTNDWKTMMRRQYGPSSNPFVGSTRKEDHKNHHHKNLHPNSPPTPDISRKSATVVASSSRRRYCSLHGVLYSLAVLFWVGATVRLALIHFQNDHPDAMTRSVLLLSSSSSSSSSSSRTGWSPLSSTKAIQRPTLLLHDDPRGEEVTVTSD